MTLLKNLIGAGLALASFLPSVTGLPVVSAVVRAGQSLPLFKHCAVSSHLPV